MRRLPSDGTQKRRTHSRQLVALVVRGGFLGHRRWLLLAKHRGDHDAEVIQDVTPVGHVLGYEHNHDVTTTTRRTPNSQTRPTPTPAHTLADAPTSLSAKLNSSHDPHRGEHGNADNDLCEANPTPDSGLQKLRQRQAGAETQDSVDGLN